jgi:uncharacterized membrane protein YeaQ/YmgE (transglycosylase-associated protein family)
MGIAGWIILGFVAGAIAKMLRRDEKPGGVLNTPAVGSLGALAGGYIASTLGLGDVSSFSSIATWLIAIGVALVLLVVHNAALGSRRTARVAMT